MKLSVVVITHNEEANIGRTLACVGPLVRDDGEIIVVDSGSTDRTLEIVRAYGAKVFVEPWKGYAAQKNSALDKASGEWILSLDADEEVGPELVQQILLLLGGSRETVKHGLSSTEQWSVAPNVVGFYIPRRNYFLGRWMKRGGFWPDPKLRLFRRGLGRFENRAVHEDVAVTGETRGLRGGALLHHSYPTLSGYIEHMNRYSSLGAHMAGPRGFSLLDIMLRPLATFVYNYFFRLGFLDGREGLLLHLYHAVYVSWKYAKAWELGRQPGQNRGSSV